MAQKQTKISASTQENLDIAGVEDGTLILKDGSYRLVLEVTAINFGLKSEREQNSIIFQFQGFLNSLHFPTEIVIQSRKLDLTPYLTKLKKRAGEQASELLKAQTLDYVDFVSELINLANIMKKRFYVVIGWENIELRNLSLVDRLFNRGNSVSLLKISQDEFKKRNTDLRERANVVASGLGSIGLHCKQLSTRELIEIFYNFYNPGIADKERLSDLKDLEAEIISQREPGPFNPEKPHNTLEESPIIDNSDLVKEQDRARKRAGAVRVMQSQAAAPTETVGTPEPQTAAEASQNTANSKIQDARNKQSPSSKSQIPNV